MILGAELLSIKSSSKSGIFVYDSQGSFMDHIGLVIRFPTMKHPHKWAVIGIDITKKVIVNSYCGFPHIVTLVSVHVHVASCLLKWVINMTFETQFFVDRHS